MTRRGGWPRHTASPSPPGENGQKAHGVIGRDGRFATEVHGLRFGPIDLYVTGLTSAADGGEGATDAKWWARLTGSFE